MSAARPASTARQFAYLWYLKLARYRGGVIATLFSYSINALFDVVTNFGCDISEND